jgi:hypothetical protein
VQSAAGSPSEEFLKSVRLGLKELKKEAKEIERTLTPKKKSSGNQKPASKLEAPTENPSLPVKRSRKKAPAANTDLPREIAVSGE